MIFEVEKSRLSGSVTISGAKNSALRLLAASILTEGKLRLRNFPTALLDAQVHCEMLEVLGKRCEISENEVLIKEEAIRPKLTWEGRSIRNTLLILGALVARLGKGRVPLPGGCALGERKYDLHVMVLEALGAVVSQEGSDLVAEAPNGLVGAEIHLPLRSTGATENAILAGSLARGITTIWNPHIRPEILDLIAMLRKMGADIEVFGQERIEIEGKHVLTGTEHRVVADNMEAITWAIAASITGGDIEIIDFPFSHLEVPLIFLRESGTEVFRLKNRAIIRGATPFPVEISTGPYPGINSDMQPLFAMYGAMSRGLSKIVDLRFIGRYNYAAELEKMGLAYSVKDNILLIEGGRPLLGTDVTALDLRAGAALVLAGLVANGTTRVHNAWQILRGYNNFAEKLSSLGGKIHSTD